MIVEWHKQITILGWSIERVTTTIRDLIWPPRFPELHRTRASPVISIGLFFTQVCRNHDISSKHSRWPSRKDLFIKQLTWSSVKTFTWVMMLGCCTTLCISSSFLKLRTGHLFLMGEPRILFPNICRTAVHTNTHKHAHIYIHTYYIYIINYILNIYYTYGNAI
jgi:hypothetical protein